MEIPVFSKKDVIIQSRENVFEPSTLNVVSFDDSEI